jgi:hypothetical protein
MSFVVLANEHRKARKPHVCCECRRKIQPGETYWHYRGTWDGDPVAKNTCDLCEQLREDVMAGWDSNDRADGFIFGSLWEYCEEEPLLSRWKAIEEKAKVTP